MGVRGLDRCGRIEERRCSALLHRVPPLSNDCVLRRGWAGLALFAVADIAGSARFSHGTPENYPETAGFHGTAAVVVFSYGFTEKFVNSSGSARDGERQQVLAGWQHIADGLIQRMFTLTN